MEEETIRVAKIYTDGSAYTLRQGDVKIKTGAWAMVATLNEEEVIETKTEAINGGTIGKMELIGVAEALIWYMENQDKFNHGFIYSDSQYVVNAYNKWMENWKWMSWQKSSPGEIAHVEIWKLMYELRKDLVNKVKVKWVRGHDGNKFNEMADELCGNARKELQENLVNKIVS